ncbi:hypothetical protein EDC94DRAFT_596469 [Helicostylum pulchrum]|nr:hypothetical protein EDC94DRAFT_596469 [Helicostylum pulchrum]
MLFLSTLVVTVDDVGGGTITFFLLDEGFAVNKSSYFLFIVVGTFNWQFQWLRRVWIRMKQKENM